MSCCYEYLKNFKFGTRKAIFGYFRHIFGLKFAKNVILVIKIPRCKQNKSVNLEAKMSYVSNLGLLFWKAIIIFDVSILKFSTKKLKFEIWKAIVIFEIRTLEFVKMKNFMQNIQIWNQKCTVSVFLICNFESRHIWNQHLPIVKIWLSINTICKRFVKQTFFVAVVQHTYTHWLTLYTDNNYMYEKISDGNKQ